RVGGCRPGGGKVLVVIAGSQRLVLALPARLRRAAGRRRDVALAGAWLVLTGRLLPSDLGGGAVPVGICLGIPAHGSAATATCGRVLGYVGCAFATRGRDERSATARDFGGHARPFEPASGSP